ncbi:MAG: ABC transporter substrate-binding protein, partial [Desulfobacterales bacterium]|nr:ABC transporter substrate-binding protein [Desulfobacterales bacterium]
MMQFKSCKSLVFILMLIAMALGTAWAGNAPRHGGSLVFVAPYDGSILTLDPHKTSKEQDFLVTINLHRSLYAWSAKANRPLPELVSDDIQVSGDGLTHTYTLKPQIKFHTGRTMTVADVIGSYERILSLKPASPARRFINVIAGAEAYAKGEANSVVGLKDLGNDRFSITFSKRIDPSYDLYQPGTAILPMDEVAKRGETFGNQPVGCGPFKFGKWVKGSEVVLEKFNGFYKENRPYLDKLVYKIMMES